MRLASGQGCSAQLSEHFFDHGDVLLNYVVPDVVHVLVGGRIVQTGGKELALEVEADGYDKFIELAAVAPSSQ